MSITSRPATAIIIIALAAFLIVSLALACSSAPVQRTAAPPAAPPADRVSAAVPSQLITPVVVLPTPTAISQPTPRAGDVNTDRAALAALYNATNGSSWQDDTNWLSNGPLGEWHGVSTDADGRVAGLGLGSNQLSGSMPPELGNLANLERLFLNDNQLSGSIPLELGNLANLERLWLYNNQLSGSMPPELGNLANLETLWLHNNQLSGSIPPELGNLANLERLGLYNNQLSESIPPELGNLANLERLHLSNNQLAGRYRRNWATSPTWKGWGSAGTS